MSEKRRVAIVMPELFHGGAETQFRMLVDNLDTERFKVTVFVERSYEGIDRAADKAWMDHRRGRARFVLFRGLRTNDGHIRRLISAARLAMYLVPYLCRREIDAAVVYSALGMRIIPLLRLLGVFVVYSERNAAVYSKLDLFRKRVYFSAANVIVCNSAAASRNFVQYSYRPLVIENAVALPSGPLMTREPRAEKRTLVIPGRIAPVKNQALVMKALPELDSIVSRVYLAGPVEDADYLKKLEDLATSVGRRSQVEVLGFVQDMDALYAKCGLVVLPSRAEGMPNVLLEALAREVPCVASDIPSNRDVLRDDRLLFDVDDSGSLVSAVRYLTQLAPPDARRLADSYRTYVMERFSLHTMVAAYERLFLLPGGGESVG